MSYEDFKQDLLARHCRLKGGYNRMPDFDGGGRANDTPAGEPVKFFPQRKDLDDVLAYGLRRAQACDDFYRASFVAGAAVILTHPFYDDNGKTHRDFYMELATGMTLEQRRQTGALAPHGSTDGPGARSVVDLGSVFSQPPMMRRINQGVYERAGLEELSEGLAYGRMAGADIAVDASGLNDDEAWALQKLTEYYQIDTYGLCYGLSYLASTGQYQPGITVHPEGKKIDIAGAIAGLSGNAKQQLVQKAHEYHKLEAMTIIDLLLADEVVMDAGDMKAPRGKITFYDYAVEQSNNLATENLVLGRQIRQCAAWLAMHEREYGPVPPYYKQHWPSFLESST